MAQFNNLNMKKIILFIPLLFTFSCLFAQTNNAYGDNQKQVEPGVFAIYSGDIDQDGIIDIFDQVILDNDVVSFSGGYIPSDLNGDASVDLFDQVILDNNVVLFIGVQSPISQGSSNRMAPPSLSINPAKN